MAERNILAYFQSPEQAEGARRKLQALRVIDVSIDRIGLASGADSEMAMDMIGTDVGGLGAAALGVAYANRSAAVMSAAHPDASGLSDQGDESLAGKDILLTAVVDEEAYDKALRIVRDCRGMI